MSISGDIPLDEKGWRCKPQRVHNMWIWTFKPSISLNRGKTVNKMARRNLVRDRVVSVYTRKQVYVYGKRMLSQA